MLSEHRQEDDEHSKIDVFYKGNRSLKPHQPGMAKIGEVQQGQVGSTHFRVRSFLSRCPFYFGLVGGWSRQPRGDLTRDCSVRNGPGFVMQGIGRNPRYCDLGHVL